MHLDKEVKEYREMLGAMDGRLQTQGEEEEEEEAHTHTHIPTSKARGSHKHSRSTTVVQHNTDALHFEQLSSRSASEHDSFASVEDQQFLDDEDDGGSSGGGGGGSRNDMEDSVDRTLELDESL